jgi:MFS transporter, DHA1 family, purine base/nucleoside efflux pump
MLAPGGRDDPEVEVRVIGSAVRLPVLAAGAFAVGTSAYVVAGVLPAISAELGVSIAAAGQLTTAFALVYAVGAPVLATVLGRWERRQVLIAALAVAALGNALSAVAQTYPLSIGGRLLTALGAAAITPAATHAATLLSPPERQGRAVAAVFTGITLSLVVWVPAGNGTARHLATSGGPRRRARVPGPVR